MLPTRRRSKAYNGWWLDVAEGYEHLKKLQDEGTRVASLDAMPDLTEDQASIIGAYHRLTASRQSTFSGVGPIPLSERIFAFNAFDLDIYLDRDAWLSIVTELEAQAREWEKAHQPKTDTKR